MIPLACIDVFTCLTPSHRFVYDLDIPLVNFRVPFHKTAYELVRRCSQANIPEGEQAVHIRDQCITVMYSTVCTTRHLTCQHRSCKHE